MTAEKTALAALLAKTRPFSEAPRPELDALAAVCTVQRFAAGSYVFIEGERAASCFLVREGRARILNVAAGARAFQIELLGPGELFGFYCRLGGRAQYPCTAVADGPLVAVRIPDAPFAALRRRNPAAAQCAIECCAGRMRLLKRAIGFGRETVGVRVVETLLSLREQFGDDIPVTRHALSVWVGAAQETVFRVLARLKERGLVSTGRGRVRVKDAQGLVRMRGEPRS